MRARKNPAYNGVCFHAQQCVEKLIKGLLIHLRKTPPRTHDLVALSDLLRKACPEWSWPVEELRLVSRAAVIYRYPGEDADREDASRVMKLASRMRLRLLALLKGSN